MGRLEDLREYLAHNYVEDLYGRHLFAREQAAADWAAEEAAEAGEAEGAVEEQAAYWDAYAAIPESEQDAAFSMPGNAYDVSAYATAPMYGSAPASASASAPAPEATREKRPLFKRHRGKAGDAARKETIQEFAPTTVEHTEAAPAPRSLSELLAHLDESFSTTLLALIDARGLEDAEVYKRAHMSRQLFSKIRSDADYRPTKRTALALALALELTESETEDLISRAGFAFSNASKADLIVRYHIERGIYDLMTINEALYAFDQPLLGQ